MRLWIDGIIFAMQRQGGISRCWIELLRRLGIHNDLGLTLHWPRSCALPSSLTTLTHRCHRQWSPRTHGIAGAYRRLQMHLAKPTIFHSTYYTLPPIASTRSVVTVHDFIDEKFAAIRPCGEHFLAIKRQVIESADAIVAVSHAMMNQIETYYRPRAEIRTVIHHAVDHPFSSQASDDAVAAFRKRYALSRPFWLYVGQRGTYKCFDTLLDAWTRTARQMETDLVVVGGQRNAAGQYSDVLTRTQLADRFYAISDIDDLSLAAAYTAAEAMIYPSIEEGFGIPLLEAMGCGTAVIASDIPVFREVAGDAAEFFSPQNTEAMIHAMTRIKDVSRRLELIRQGIARVQTYSWDRSAQMLIDVYRQVDSLRGTS